MIVGPWKVTLPYKPYETFDVRVKAVAWEFFEALGSLPNVCYVSSGFEGKLPGVIVMWPPDDKNATVLRFKRQTLLALDEIIIGYEIAIPLEVSNAVTERSIN